ncbi:hypothetical protein SPRG_10777 [Saprolegnia parasitica CBS 223.65]|uniref:RING-type domain-containing protein n=1 Tax=Saprolegnia parasitica (strain CBS 223.65) TaxID=695850 RepID=A0A067C9U3_SAPPC|nr:hypothetical protein SPRG_10777 [Saprolegnia parasitica CBS 223.65]KDO23582.1 hypothetical protein SPRG_10777 [Saprolegnia parasitica CBS 223.65]|eukprot:XP_012205730.1 hypothetical protein SPRG_10777 [Saprolegnia parasitica CBS 223.65]
MGQSCSCLDQSHPHSRRRSSSSPMSLQGDATARAEGLLHQPSKAIEASVVKRNPRTLDHESAYTAFVYKGMEHPPSSKKTEASGVSEPRSSTDTTILELECVMCLDTFSDENPKIRTLCNCGVNRTNFHLACLAAPCVGQCSFRGN